MRKSLFTLLCLAAMLVVGTGLKAQEITIELAPGWNWISYPNVVAMQVGEALDGFTPMEGDIIQLQFASSKYINGHWRGGVTQFVPGWGIMYYSARPENVEFAFSQPSSIYVSTDMPIDITETTALLGGFAFTVDGTSLLMKGICWATHPHPTTYDSYSENGSGMGDFTEELTELTPNTVYYVRAYAVSVKGVNYGEEMSFSTLDDNVPMGAINGLFSVGEDS